MRDLKVEIAHVFNPPLFPKRIKKKSSTVVMSERQN